MQSNDDDIDTCHFLRTKDFKFLARIKLSRGLFHLPPVSSQITFNLNGKQKLFLNIEHNTQKVELASCRLS